MATASEGTGSCEAVEVPLAQVERELDRQLKGVQGPGDSPIIRSRMSNLIVYTEHRHLCDYITELIPALVSHHPARVVILGIDEEAPEDRVTATVHTRVHGIGKGLRAFSELVTLRSSPSSQAKLNFALKRLVIGDLPINLWWAVPKPPAMGGTLLYELAESAHQVIYDSYGWQEPARGLTATASWLNRFERPAAPGARRRIASDLTWRRLAPWRRLVIEALDHVSAPGALETVEEILFDHGPHSVTSAWTLASWMILHLDWEVETVSVKPGAEITWQLRSNHGPRTMRIRRIGDVGRGIQWLRLGCEINGTPGALNLSPAGDRRLKIQPEGFDATARTVTVPDRSIDELIAQQLSDREHDDEFRKSMEVAQNLALSVLRPR